MQKSTLVTLLIIVVILIVAGVYTFSQLDLDSEVDSEAAQALGSFEGEVIYTDVNGNPLNLAQYAGQVRVVNAWASWCPFCVTELPDFNELATEFKDRDVVVLAINRKEANEVVKSYIATNRLSDDIIFVQDPKDTFYRSIGGFSMPETVFYDKSGNISTHKRGFMSLDEMRVLTEKALNATNRE